MQLAEDHLIESFSYMPENLNETLDNSLGSEQGAHTSPHVAIYSL